MVIARRRAKRRRVAAIAPRPAGEPSSDDTHRAYSKASSADGGDLFGYSVGLNADGNTLIVGGYDEDGSDRTVNAIPDNLRY